MASNLTVTASAQTSRSTELRPFASIREGGDVQPFVNLLVQEVSNRREGQADLSDQKKLSTGKLAVENKEETLTSAQAAQPWLAMLQAQTLLAQVSPTLPDIKMDVSTNGAAIDLAKIDQSLLAEVGVVDVKDLTGLGSTSLKPESTVVGGLNAAKFASVRQKITETGVAAESIDNPAHLLNNSSVPTAPPWLAMLQAQAVLAQAPQAVLDQIPQVALAQAPQAVLDQIPQVALAQAPQAVLAQIPQVALAQAPQAVLAQIPQVALAQTPQVAFAQAPQAVADTHIQLDISRTQANVNLDVNEVARVQLSQSLLGKVDGKSGENLTNVAFFDVKQEKALLGEGDVTKWASLPQNADGTGRGAALADGFSAIATNSSMQTAQSLLAMQSVAQVTPAVFDAKAEISSGLTGLELTNLSKGAFTDEDVKQHSDLNGLERLGLKSESGSANVLDSMKFASLRQKAVGADEFAVSADDFSVLVPNLKENTLQSKIEAAPQVILHTPVVEAKPALPSQYAVAEPVGGPRWGDAIAQRVSMMLQDQHQQIDMQLNPPHLGPMEVRLTMSGEQASVVFSSQHASVREALAAATPRLTTLLADQGIQLSNVQVASDSLNQHAQQQSHQQASSQQMDSQRQPRSRNFLGDLTGAYADGQPQVLVDIHVPVARSGLNLYV
jgi:flagellar hook-length control protein FliK